MSYNNKKFLDANGVTQIVGLLDDYATNEALTAVVNSVDNAISAKYTKPSGGIPATDLASGVIPNIPVTDVQVNGSTILNNGVANVPKAGNSSNAMGVVYAPGDYGVGILGSGGLYTARASSAQIKAGNNSSSAALYKPITPQTQHEAVYYALANLAGADMASLTGETVGVYPEAQKAAIQSMLGVSTGATLIENISGTTPSITALPNVRYICGEISTLSITPPSAGSCEVIFTSGSTATTLTVPNTVKWPAWFDDEALESNKIYDIIITDGVYGAVMSWAS